MTLQAKTPFASAMLTFPRGPRDLAHRKAVIDVGKILECALFYDTVVVDADRPKWTSKEMERDANHVVTNPKDSFLLPESVELGGYNGTEKTEIVTYLNSMLDRRIIRRLKTIYQLETRLYSNINHPVIIVQPILAKMINYDEDGLSSHWIEQFNRHWLSHSGGLELVDQLEIILKDRHRSSLIAQNVLTTFLPNFPYTDDMYFFGERNDINVVSIYTNINLVKLASSLNEYYEYTYIYGGGNSACFILDKMNELIELSWKSSRSELAIWATSALEVCMKSYYADFIYKGRRSEVELFESTVLHNVKSIAESINSGQLNLNSFRSIYDESRKFRDWARKTEERELLQDYVDELNRVPWLDKLPSKGARFTVITALGLGLDFLGAGGIGSAAGIAAGALDTFILDKVYQGWRPSMFVSAVKSALA
jgi:hypothetical protein